MGATKKISHLSYKNKVAIAFFSVALVCTIPTLIYVIFHLLDYSEDTFLNENKSLAKVISLNVAAPLAFDDLDAAQNILISLDSSEAVSNACIYDSAKKLFAAFEASNDNTCSPSLPDTIEEGTVVQAISRLGRTYGHLMLHTNRAKLINLQTTLVVTSIMLFLTFIFVLVVPIIFILRKSITSPIQELIQSANQLHIPSNKPLEGDELLIIAEKFNAIKQYIAHLELANSEMTNKMYGIKNNYQTSHKLLQKETKLTKDIAYISNQYINQNDLTLKESRDLYRSIDMRMNDHLNYSERIIKMFSYVDDFVGQSYETVFIKTMFTELFESYFYRFDTSRALLVPIKIKSDEIKCYKGPLERFLIQTFMFLDFIFEEKDKIQIELSSLTHNEHTDFIEYEIHALSCCYKNVFIEDEIFLTTSEENNEFASQYNPDEIKIKSLVESMKFYANFNYIDDRSNLKLLFTNSSVTIKFKMINVEVTHDKS